MQNSHLISNEAKKTPLRKYIVAREFLAVGTFSGLFVFPAWV